MHTRYSPSDLFFCAGNVRNGATAACRNGNRAFMGRLATARSEACTVYVVCVSVSVCARARLSCVCTTVRAGLVNVCTCVRWECVL